MIVISDVQVQLKLEDAEECKQTALRLVNTRPEAAAAYLQQAACIHFEIASHLDQSADKTSHLKHGRRLKQHAALLAGEQTMEHEEQFQPAVTTDETASSRSEATTGTSDSATAVEDTEFFAEPPDQDLSDVGGMAELKDRLREDVVEPLEHPEFYEKQGAGIENGVLLYGPPGTGKTHLTTCFAGELGYPYARVKVSELVSKWVGEGAQNIDQLFREARRCEPCVLFLDELDSIGTERGSLTETKSERQMVTQLLDELDRVQDSQVLVVASTNKPGDLDEAITRSGRFNQTYAVGPPDAAARKQILGVQLDEDGRAIDWESIDWPKLVEWSAGYSAADLATVVDKAVRKSAAESTDRGELVPVQYRHLLQALKETDASLEHWNHDG